MLIDAAQTIKNIASLALKYLNNNTLGSLTPYNCQLLGMLVCFDAIFFKIKNMND
jgi:hypothetical protein